MVDILHRHSKEFCSEMNRLFQCRTSDVNPELCNCDIFCPFRIAADVEKWCNEEGIKIRKALERWAVKKIPDSKSFMVLADALGYEVGELKELIAVIRKAHERNRE